MFVINFGLYSGISGYIIAGVLAFTVLAVFFGVVYFVKKGKKDGLKQSRQLADYNFADEFAAELEKKNKAEKKSLVKYIKKVNKSIELDSYAYTVSMFDESGVQNTQNLEAENADADKYDSVQHDGEKLNDDSSESIHIDDVYKSTDKFIPSPTLESVGGILSPSLTGGAISETLSPYENKHSNFETPKRFDGVKLEFDEKADKKTDSKISEAVSNPENQEQIKTPEAEAEKYAAGKSPDIKTALPSGISVLDKYVKNSKATDNSDKNGSIDSSDTKIKIENSDAADKSSQTDKQSETGELIKAISDKADANQSAESTTVQKSVAPQRPFQRPVAPPRPATGAAVPSGAQHAAYSTGEDVLPTPKRVRKAPKSEDGFDESVIYGKYVIEHEGEEYFYTLYNPTDRAVFLSGNYSSLEACKNAIERFKAHARAGSTVLETKNGKFRFVLKCNIYEYRSGEYSSADDAGKDLNDVKYFAQTDIIREQ